MRLNVDTSGVEIRQTGYDTYDGPAIKPGTYNAQIVKANFRKTKAGATAMNFILRIGHDARPNKDVFAGATIFHEVYPESPAELTQIRVGQILQAISGKQKAVVDGEELTAGGAIKKIGGKDPVGAKVKILVNMGRNMSGDLEPQVNDVFAWPKGEKWLDEGPATGSVESSSDEDIEEDDTDSDEGVEEEEVVEEDADEDEEEAAEDDEFESRKAELTALDRDALKKVLAEVKKAGGLPEGFKLTKSTPDSALVEAILAYEFAEDDEAEPEEDEDGEEPF